MDLLARVRHLFYLLFKIYFGLCFFISLSVLYPLFYVFLSRKAGFKYAFYLKRFWALFLQFAYLSPISLRKIDNLPKGPKIICSNHSSYLDIIFMYRVIPHYFLFMGKNELLKWPLFRLFFKKQDIAVDRRNAAGAALAFKRAKEAIQRGESIAIFPEGTIPPEQPKLHRFKDGAFKLAIECQVPIVPISFCTNWKLLRDAEHWAGTARPGIAKVIIHPAISTKGMNEADLVPLRQKVFEIIDNSLRNGSN